MFKAILFQYQFIPIKWMMQMCEFMYVFQIIYRFFLEKYIITNGSLIKLLIFFLLIFPYFFFKL